MDETDDGPSFVFHDPIASHADSRSMFQQHDHTTRAFDVLNAMRRSVCDACLSLTFYSLSVSLHSYVTICASYGIAFDFSLSNTKGLLTAIFNFHSVHSTIPVYYVGTCTKVNVMLNAALVDLRSTITLDFPSITTRLYVMLFNTKQLSVLKVVPTWCAGIVARIAEMGVSFPLMQCCGQPVVITVCAFGFSFSLGTSSNF